MTQQRTSLISLALLAMIFCSVTQAQTLDRGHQTLLDRGLQLQAMVHPNAVGYFDIDRWIESNFTTIGLSGATYDPTPGLLPAAPGIPWTRWLYHSGSYPPDPTDSDILPSEYPFASNLINLQIKDEQDITDPTELANLAGAFAGLHSLYPDVIVHTNQSGGQFTAPEIRNYMQQTQPDMLMFDSYPFFDVGPDPFGVPTYIYSAMEKYRLLGLAGNDGTGTQPIPVGQYTQTYTPPPENEFHHIVSESEIRLNNFSSWAFGYKLVHSFVYELNPGAATPVMFEGTGTDNPTPQFYYVAETNRQSLNLGPALTRLLSTEVHILIDGAGNEAPEPPSPGEPRLFFWDGTEDPYITDIDVANLGTIKGGTPGDVVVGYFKPLDPAFVDPGHQDDIYFMIVNGLSDRNASAADTAQEIHMEFDFAGTNINSLQRISRDTGHIEEVPLVSDGGSLYHLDLTLEGGTGDLFKFNDGSSFLGLPEQMTMHMEEAADQSGVPAGYTTYEFYATTETNLAAFEMILQASEPGSIYQHAFGNGYVEPNPALIAVAPELEFDTYVTLGAWPYPSPTNVVGPAVDIDENAVLSFDDTTLNITWAISDGSYLSGPGTFLIARVTLANDASATWTLRGQQTGFDAILLNDLIHLHGDADGDGFVGADDLVAVLTYWGQTDPPIGDLSGDGFVGSDDYVEVLTYWGNGSVAPEPAPEPATLGLLLFGLALLKRQQRRTQSQRNGILGCV